MTYSQAVVVIVALLIPVQLSAQANERDQRALMILTQTINAAGGVDLLNGIHDFTGTGTITYYWDEEVHGTVTVKGSGTTRFRLDASLSGGMKSTVIKNGTGFLKERDGTISVVPFGPHLIVLPYAELVDALNEPAIGVTYIGLVKHHGRFSHHIQVRHERVPRSGRAPANGPKTDYYIDPYTFLISNVVEAAAPGASSLVHNSQETELADYHLVAGILAPFSITKRAHGQRLLSMNLTEFLFNQNVANDDFKP